ncbi:MAG: AzlD domain-containing protein [Rhodobacteraceae bacterium]|nr:AzlD domain-containing protein [Paracoccaceae bacterium]
MSSWTDSQIWLLIAGMGIGTYLIRLSFLGLIGDRELHPFVLRCLRYVPVAVLPGLVAPLVVWPAATEGQPDLARMLAAAAALMIGAATRSMIAAILGGMAVLYLGLWLI